MSLHRSLKTKPAALNNVLTRAERIVRLTETGSFAEGENSPIGLPKVANRQVVTKKKKAEETEQKTEVTEETETES